MGPLHFFFYMNPRTNDMGPGCYLQVFHIGPPIGPHQFGLGRFRVGICWMKNVIPTNLPKPPWALGLFLGDPLMTLQVRINPWEAIMV